MQSITAVKQRPARPVSLNPLRTGQPADRMMDDDHSMKDEAAEVEDIEDRRSMVLKGKSLHWKTGSVHLLRTNHVCMMAAWARMWFRWRQNQHMVVWTRKKG